MKKQYRSSSAGRLGSNLPKLLSRGMLVDRNQTKRGGKKIVLIEAPDSLMRFFRPVGQS